jgi:arginine-tRNA-protein transferase
MEYKTRFRPLERLGRDGWKRMGEELEPELPIALPVRTQRHRLLIDA